MAATWPQAHGSAAWLNEPEGVAAKVLRLLTVAYLTAAGVFVFATALFFGLFVGLFVGSGSENGLGQGNGKLQQT